MPPHIRGGVRAGVSRPLVTRAPGEAGGVDPAPPAHPLLRDREPSPPSSALRPGPARGTPAARPTRAPGPSRLSRSAIGRSGRRNGEWDGIRCPPFRRGGRTFLRSRGEESVTGRQPEPAAVGDALPERTVV